MENRLVSVKPKKKKTCELADVMDFDAFYYDADVCGCGIIARTARCWLIKKKKGKKIEYEVMGNGKLSRMYRVGTRKWIRLAVLSGEYPRYY